MESMLQQLSTLWQQAIEIWLTGGWAMAAIAVVSLVMFGLGVHLYIGMRSKGFEITPESRWRQWLHHPEQRQGPIGDMLDFVSGSKTIQDVAVAFEELRATELAPFRQDLLVMKVCVGAAPLLGLLGTVTGMLTTFSALSSGSGGDKTMGLIAQGISEALVTTETGLIIALPGLFFHYQMSRKFQRYKAFLTHLETVCTQQVYKQGLKRAAQQAAHETETPNLPTATSA